MQINEKKFENAWSKFNQKCTIRKLEYNQRTIIEKDMHKRQLIKSAKLKQNEF